MPLEEPFVPEILDGELFTLLQEVCASYKSFNSALVKWLAQKREEGSLETWTSPGLIGYWLTYLLQLGYDVGFIALAVLREGLDRQLLTLKRQALEYSVRAQYFTKYPEKAEQQYAAFPLKMRSYLERLGSTEANEAFSETLATIELAASALPPGAGPRYGEVSMFDMMRSIYPDDFARVYARHYWLPSATMHGFQIGMLDVQRRMKDGKFWMSHFSLTSTRTENVLVITDSLLRLLMITGDRFDLRGTHWISLCERYNSIVARIAGDSRILDLPIDAIKLEEASSYTPRKPRKPPNHDYGASSRE